MSLQRVSTILMLMNWFTTAGYSVFMQGVSLSTECFTSGHENMVQYSPLQPSYLGAIHVPYKHTNKHCVFSTASGPYNLFWLALRQHNKEYMPNTQNMEKGGVER